MLDALREFGAVIMALIGLGIWLVRLEGRVNANSKDLIRMDQRIDRERSDTRETLADLKDMLAEQNRDIKTLLGRGRVVHWDDKTQPPR
ncbi:hypothetical protein SAMN04489859_1008133 [Paracoccus alcaliphilus]|uniref:Uncharacterized protein n=1 Tax=Paracoccus alcaliphilus TaxID=34002 RepID=A0A1H8H580_9RHOB|nr:hypothetical protein [Paracoccus alcaliphilus]WCR17359.1 hypothetical protein JHW40_13560 [Paracoccus alcaliphilus]SEN51551.1 hypothetical protein SAMN04489859_1008133 [Paracoccus alcaliphilus]